MQKSNQIKTVNEDYSVWSDWNITKINTV